MIALEYEAYGVVTVRIPIPVAVLLGAVDQLGLVDHVGDVLKDDGGQLHPHAHVHLVVQQLQPQALHWLANHSAPLRPGAPIR